MLFLLEFVLLWFCICCLRCFVWLVVLLFCWIAYFDIWVLLLLLFELRVVGFDLFIVAVFDCGWKCACYALFGVDIRRKLGVLVYFELWVLFSWWLCFIGCMFVVFGVCFKCGFGLLFMRCVSCGFLVILNVYYRYVAWLLCVLICFRFYIDNSLLFYFVCGWFDWWDLLFCRLD